MIDTHAHLSSRFAQDVDLSLLKYIILSASNQQDSVDNLALAKTNPKLLPSVGIHPSEVWADIDAQINFLDYLLSQNPNIVAVGECGLEFVENINKKQQEILFRAQICLAQKYHKPLIVHSREASDETIDILSQYQDLTGVIHCYTGGKKRIPKSLSGRGITLLTTSKGILTDKEARAAGIGGERVSPMLLPDYSNPEVRKNQITTCYVGNIR